MIFEVIDITNGPLTLILMNRKSVLRRLWAENSLVKNRNRFRHGVRPLSRSNRLVYNIITRCVPRP